MDFSIIEKQVNMEEVRQLLEQDDVAVTSVVVKAAAFAKYFHAGQTRRGGDGKRPYFDEHIIGVFGILKYELGVLDEEILAVALLHDTVEDTECTFADLQEHFGESIAKKVKLLTKAKGEPFPSYMGRMLKDATSDVVLVKLADRLHNLRTIMYVNDVRWIKKKVRQTYRDILEGVSRFDLGEDDPLREKIRVLTGMVRSQLMNVELHLLERESKGQMTLWSDGMSVSE